MFHAIENNKAGRNFSNEEIDWRMLFTASEDSLTSSVLGTLLYLPEKHFWSIVQKATGSRYFNDLYNIIEEVIFWPSWNAENTLNKDRVEPDVLIRTSRFDLIIEAKKEDCDQLINQWSNECISYCNEYPGSNKPFLFLALGGNIPFEKDKISLKKMPSEILTCRWRELLFHCVQTYEHLERSEALPSHLKRIFGDVIKAFRIHGFLHIEWLSSLCDSPHLNIHEEAVAAFRQMKPLRLFKPGLYSYQICQPSIEFFKTSTYD